MAYTGTDLNKAERGWVKSRSAVNVKDYGAVGDGVTDDTEKIQNAIGDLEANDMIVFPSSAGYLCSEPLVFPSNVNIIMESPVIYTGSLEEIFITVGSSTITAKKKIKINCYRNTQSDWTDEGNIGIKLINMNDCDIEVVQSSNFTIGVLATGDAASFVYNNIKLYRLQNNHKGLVLTNANSGWCNENIFTSLKIGVNTGVNTTTARYGIVITSDGGDYYNNNNNFIKPAIELNASNASEEAVAILTEYGKYNSFVMCRDENNDLFVRESNDSYGNNYDIGYGNGTIEQTVNSPTYSITKRKTSNVDNVKSLVYDSGYLPNRTCYYDGNTSMNIPNMVFNATSGTIINKSSAVSLGADYVEIASTMAIGQYINTELAKRFVVKRDVDINYEGRVVVVCFDSAGNILTSAGENHPYVKSSESTVFSYTTSFDGAYQQGADYNTPMLLTFHSDVKKALILVRGSTAVCRIRSFTIHALGDYAPIAYSGYEHFGSENVGTAAPTAGTWKVGKKVYNVAPSAGGTMGWVCTTAGTPGTWKTFGAIEP